jgi:hypothetical protein
MKRIIGISVSIFFISSFMTQIETLFFGEAFPILTTADILLIMSAPLPSIIAATLMGVRFFGEKEPAESETTELKALVPRIVFIGVIYLAVYFIFGYFVAWQFEELRVFYSGSVVDLGFIGQVMSNDAIIFPFQIFRGILFALGILPLLYMLRQSKAVFTVGVCLVYLCTAIVLIIPNVLFPNVIRWAHFYEMLSSMLVFGIITGLILYPVDKRQPLKDHI